jgi:hypothetical protein
MELSPSGGAVNSAATQEFQTTERKLFTILKEVWDYWSQEKQ